MDSFDPCVSTIDRDSAAAVYVERFFTFSPSFDPNSILVFEDGNVSFYVLRVEDPEARAAVRAESFTVSDGKRVRLCYALGATLGTRLVTLFRRAFVRLQVPGWETASAAVVPIDGFVLSNLPSNVAYMTVTVFQMGTAGDVGAVNYDAVAAQLLESYIVVVIDMFDSSGLYVSDPLELDLCFSSLDPTLQFGAYELDSGDPPALHAWEEVRPRTSLLSGSNHASKQAFSNGD